MEPERSAGVIIFHKTDGVRKFLFLKSSRGFLDFPKGNVESGESVEQAAKREVFEETGISDLRFVPFKDEVKYFYQRDGKRISKTVFFLLAETRSNNVKISFEHEGFVWLSFEEALEEVKFENQKQLLARINDSLRKLDAASLARFG